MKPVAVVAATLSSLLLAGAASAQREVRPLAFGGPLPVRSQFPLELIALDLTPRSGDWLDRGDWRFEAQVVHSNTFELVVDHDLVVADFEGGGSPAGPSFVSDGETTRVALRFDWGLGRRVQLGVEVPVLHHDEGFLDSTIDSIHDTFGLPDNDRDLRPEDRLDHDVIAGGRRFRLTEPTTELGDAVLRVQVGLNRWDRGAVSLELSAKAPTGDEASLAGSGSWDYGAALLLTAGGRRHAFHGGLGWFSIGEPEALPIELDDKLSLHAGWEWLVSERWTLLAQVLAETSSLPEIAVGPYDQERVEVVGGFRYGAGARGGWSLEAGLVENLTTNDNTADFGLFLSCSYLR